MMTLPSMKPTATPLQQTKLYRPLLSRVALRRPRLIALLDSGHNLPLTLVTAPAGSGKTTLLCDWLTTYPGPNAWLSLDESDGDLGVFLSYFVAAIQTAVPGACANVQAMLQAPEQPPPHVLAAALSNAIDSLHDEPALSMGQRLVLVLDDYHLLHSQAVNELLITLLRHPSPALRLVLASRSDPALPLPALRAHDQLLEVRYQQLRFDEKEAAAYLSQVLATTPSAETTAALVQRTEGWITALHLAGLYARHAPNPDDLLSSTQVGDRYAMDYLVDEVLALLPAEIHDFLLQTAILDRLCGPLAERVVGVDDLVGHGRAYLEWLEHANLFIIALDDQWYRYHQLFQRLLQNRLGQRFSHAQVAELHRRASAWFASNGLVEEAIMHAQAAGDEPAVVRIVAAHRHEAMNQERWQQLDRWLRLMPRRLIDESPELLLLEAWILQQQWRFLEVGPLLDRIEASLEAGGPAQPNATSLRAEVDALRSLVSYFRLEGKATAAFANRALATLPMAYSSVRGLAWLYSAGGLQTQGDMASARAVLQTGLQEDRHHLNAFPSRVLIGQCVVHWMTADLADLSLTATHFLRLASERHLSESMWWARLYRGCAAYQRNDLAAAERDFAAVVEQRYIAHSHPFTQSAYGLASVWQAQGAGEAALALVETVLAYGMEIDNVRVQIDAQAFQAWLMLSQGRQAAALRWATTVDLNAPLVPMTTFHVAALTLAKVLLSDKAPANLEKVAHLLARLRSHVEGAGNTRFQIEVLALYALLDDALGRQEAALAHLQAAVALAQPGGLQRVFIDLGAPMVRLLTQLVRQGRAASYAAQLLAAFATRPAPPVRPPLPPTALIEPLTYREQEVLELLAQRLSAKEIAQRLVISDRTAKRHTANIYQKLGVNNRREAITMANTLGILARTA